MEPAVTLRGVLEMCSNWRGFESLRLAHEVVGRRDAAPIENEENRTQRVTYCTTTVTCFVDRPNWLVAFSVYVVVAVGVMVMVPPRTPPSLSMKS